MMTDQQRPEWMTSIASTVNPEDYLLGRKIDKTFELSQKEKTEKAREARIELIVKDKIKLGDDPILDLERRRRELKMQIIQNPVLRRQFRDWLLRETRAKTELTSSSGEDIKTTHKSSNCVSPSDRGLSTHEKRDRDDNDSPRRKESGDRRHRRRENESGHRRIEGNNRSSYRNSSDYKSRDSGDRRDRDHREEKSSRRDSERHSSRNSRSRHDHRSSHRSQQHRYERHERRERSRSP